MKKMRKAEVSFLMKSIYLILVFITVLIVINQLFTLNLITAENQRELDKRKTVNDILEILTASPSCFAYEEMGDIKDHQVKLATHRVVDVNKLESFALNYADIEPDCARSYRYRFAVEVEKFDISKTIDVSKKWNFGIKTSSLGDAQKQVDSGSTPITIRINDVETQPGIIRVTLYDGDLESLTGVIDRVCSTNTEENIEIKLSYPIYLGQDGSSLCMNYNKGDFCLKFACKRQVEFSNVNAGNYKIRIVPIGDKIKVET